MNTENLEPDQLDRVVQARLRRLGQYQPDSSRLERRLESAIGELRKDEGPRLRWPIQFRRSLLAAAALIAIAATLTIVLTRATDSAGAVQLSEVVLAHQTFLNGNAHLINVEDVGQANRECQGRSPDAPTIPALEGVSVRCCCVEEFCGCRSSCLHFDYEGVPVTMAVIVENEFDAPGVSLLKRDGRSYKVLSDGAMSVVATTGSDRCICLVSEMPVENLLALASRIDS